MKNYKIKIKINKINIEGYYVKIYFTLNMNGYKTKEIIFIHLDESLPHRQAVIKLKKTDAMRLIIINKLGLGKYIKK